MVLDLTDNYKKFMKVEIKSLCTIDIGNSRVINVGKSKKNMSTLNEVDYKSFSYYEIKYFFFFFRRQDHGNDVDVDVQSGGFMCPSTVKYARPKRARATSGLWKYIVNTGEYTQTLRLEMCT